MTAEEIYDYVQGLRDLAYHLERNVKHPIMENAYLYGFDINFYLTENDYNFSKDENGKRVNSTVFNETKTKHNVKNFLDFIGSCDKEYVGGSLELTRKFGKHSISADVTRNLTCKKIVTGTEVVPERVIAEHVREITEWDCNDAPSLLALVKEG